MKQFYPTKRLLLVLAEPSLAAAVADYYRRNKAFFEAVDPKRDDTFFTEEYQRRVLQMDQENADRAAGFRFYLCLKEKPEEIIGMVALNNIVWGSFESCFMGYKLDKDHLRQGLMSEAVNECVRIGFEELGLHRIEANIMPRNKASLGVAAKCGFVNEGVSPKYLRINGVWEDHVHMVILNEEQ